ncbi:MAG: neutral zinc metallopeptidase [Burkholderiaceae bacterium]|nr:neutral zinc metallopeptidase [Burkholderiaceae bacterium]
MKWEGNRRSDNVEDRRGQADDGQRPAAGLGGLGGRGGLGLGTVLIALLAGWLFGINPLTILGALDGGGLPSPGAPAPATTRPAPPVRPSVDDRQAQFVSTVLADTEDVWRAQFGRGPGGYREPTLVLFRGRTATACGLGQAAMGPFYCPGDEKVYIDLGFYDTLRQRLGAPGDFAQAYVIAHEVGHHVQHLMGITEKVEAQRRRASQAQANALSVRLELQADCLAGVWAFHAQRSRQILERGDIEEALNAAAKIGDDALQRAAQGTVLPETFTHGSSAQRQRWFQRGLQGGRVDDCNTFAARQL